MKYLSIFIVLRVLLLPTILFADQDQIAKDLGSDVVSGFTEVTRKLDESTSEQPCDLARSTENKDFLISDSFVKQLDCKTLTRDSVFSSLQETAFSEDKGFLSPNYESGGLGQCWALASAQRRIYYLTRFNVKHASDSIKADSVEEFLKMIGNDKSANVIETESLNMKDYGGAPLSPLASAIHENNHAYQKIIESNQRSLFFRLRNLPLIFGKMVKDSDENTKMFNEVLKKFDRGERPLLIKRQEAMSQHVIMVKNIKKKGENNYVFDVFDSLLGGLPTGLDKFAFKDGQFYQITKSEKIASGPLGFVMPYDDDMDKIREILYKYYKGLCDQKQK